MANVQVANIHEYIIGHDLLAGKTLVTGGKYSFKVHTNTVGNMVTFPAFGASL